MSAYVNSWNIRYSIWSLQQQTETALIKSAQDINNEDPATPNHTNRVSWANWANKNSATAKFSFMWAIAMNPSIQSAIAADPTGATVTDSDVQFVVNSALPEVIADFVAHPPPGA